MSVLPKSWFSLGPLATLLTLGALATAFWLGHHFEWKPSALTGLWSKADKDGDASAGEEEKTSAPVMGEPFKLKEPDSASRAGLETAKVEERPLTDIVSAFGSLDYDQTRYAHLTPRIQGTVWRVEKHQGESVRKGDVLAILECTEVGKAKSDFLLTLGQVSIKTALVEQLRVAGSVIPARTMRDAEAALREAHIRLLNDQQALANLGLPVRSEEVAKLPEKELARHMRLLDLPSKIVATIDADSVTANLLPIHAPFDGEIVSRDVVLGEVASPNVPLFTMADLGRLWAVLEVRREDADRLALGQEVTFVPDGVKVDAASELSQRNDIAHGRVTWISREADPRTRTIKVRAEVKNPQLRFRPNTFGTGRIIVRREPAVLMVPADAIQSEGSLRFVFIKLSDQEFEARPVTVVVRVDRDVVVQGNLKAGDKVVTTGSHVLKGELFKARIGGDE